MNFKVAAGRQKCEYVFMGLLGRKLCEFSIRRLFCGIFLKESNSNDVYNVIYILLIFFIFAKNILNGTSS